MTSTETKIQTSNPIPLETVLLVGVANILVFYWIKKLFMKRSQDEEGSFNEERMDGKTVIVTGANGGIGKETSLDLAKRGARVIMACRNLELANKARDEIMKATGSDKVIVKQLDLSSFKSVREFAADVVKTENRLDVLVHNAGYAGAFKKFKSVDGIEMTFATNHYGPFLLTHLLIDLLKKSGPSRIVVVASGLYTLASVNLEKLNPVDTVPTYLYYSSKAANIMFSTELAKRLEGSEVTVNCLHPGIIDTGIWRNVPFPLTLPMGLINKLFFKTAVEGAKTTIYLATSEDVEGLSGGYYNNCEEAQLKPYVTDDVKCKKLWEESVKMVKLTSSDPKI